MSFLLKNLLQGSFGAGLSSGEYDKKLNEQASALINKSSLSLMDVRELLILSAARSCVVAHRYFQSECASAQLLEHLLAVIADEDDFGSGDARIQAAYYLKLFDNSILTKQGHVLKRLLSSDDGPRPGGSLVSLLDPICARIGLI